MLAKALSASMPASARLKVSYTQLQCEVAALRLELSAQNAAVTKTLAENNRMHFHLQQIVDSMPCGVLILDEDGAIAMINPEGVRLLAIETARPVSLLEIEALSLMSLDPQDAVSARMHATHELCLNDEQGKRWLEVRTRLLVPHPTDATEARQCIVTVRDVSAQRRDELATENGRKAMALAEITTMPASALTDPLATLELLARLVENDVERRSGWISHLPADIRLLAETANYVPGFNRADTLRLAPVALAPLIERAIHCVRPVAAEAEVSLQWLSAEDQCVVMANESALQQVVLNLLLHAIRQTPAGGRVAVCFRSGCRQGSGQAFQRGPVGMVVVDFIDSGCRTRPEVERIFEPGLSGSGDTSGLGLAVCREIMKQHNGTIAAGVCDPSGPRFELRLPVLLSKVATA